MQQERGTYNTNPLCLLVVDCIPTQPTKVLTRPLIRPGAARIVLSPQTIKQDHSSRSLTLVMGWLQAQPNKASQFHAWEDGTFLTQPYLRIVLFTLKLSNTELLPNLPKQSNGLTLKNRTALILHVVCTPFNCAGLKGRGLVVSCLIWYSPLKPKKKR